MFLICLKVWAGEKRYDELSDQIEVIMAKYHIPGLCGALVSGDSIVWKDTFGYANLDRKQKMEPNTPFKVASISKSFVGLAFLRLQEDNKINLNQSIKAFLPDIPIENLYEKTHPVKIIHLLEHTSGFDAAHFYEYYNFDQHNHNDLAEILKKNPSSRKVRWEPGTRIAYTNHGYAVAGLILERVTQRKFEDWMDKNVFLALGMKHTTFKDEKVKNKAIGYTEDLQAFPDVSFYLKPATSAVSTLGDMAIFLQMLINQGKVKDKQFLSEESIRRMGETHTTLAGEKGIYAGYGIGLKKIYEKGYICYSFSGGIPGFTSIFVFSKESKKGFVLMMNSSDTYAFFKIYDLLFSEIIKGLDKSEISPKKVVYSVNREQLTGYYSYQNPDENLSALFYYLFNGVKIKSIGDSLFLLKDKKELKLYPVGDNLYKRQYDPDVRIAFGKDKNGRQWMSDMSAFYYRIPVWKMTLLKISLTIAIVLLVSQILFFLFWFPVFIFRKIRGSYQKGSLLIRVLPLLAVLVLILGAYSLKNDTPKEIIHFGQYNLSSIYFYLSTLVFTGLTILSFLMMVFRVKNQSVRLLEVYYMLVNFSLVVLLIVMIHWGLWGLKLWHY